MFLSCEPCSRHTQPCASSLAAHGHTVGRVWGCALPSGQPGMRILCWPDDTTANGLKRVVGQWEVLAGWRPLEQCRSFPRARVEETCCASTPVRGVLCELTPASLKVFAPCHRIVEREPRQVLYEPRSSRAAEAGCGQHSGCGTAGMRQATIIAMRTNAARHP